MPKERNKADDYREKAYICPFAYAASPFGGDAQRYELAANGGDAQAQFATGWFLMTGTGVFQDERKGLKWIHKSTFQGYQPAIDYCKEHGYKWYWAYQIALIYFINK